MAKSIDFLNFEFTQVQKGQGFNTGSITPRTTTNKIILDKVEISDSAKNFYEENINKISQNNYNKLGEELIIKEKENKLLQGLVDINKGEKTYKNLLDGVNNNIKPITLQLEELVKSSKVQIVGLNGFCFETIYQEDINGSKEIVSNAPAVLRYGLDIESKALNIIVGSVIEKGVLHPYEEAIFQNAFEYLKMVESAESYIKAGDTKYYPNNVVLVDIFDRSSGFINKGNNQTHTIALWKKKDGEIVLIDPSQKSYSDHLLAPLKSKFVINVNTLEYKTLYGVAVYKGNEITDYSDYIEQNPKPRDCVDIAVKVALELNEQQKFSNLEKITDNMLQQISNEAKNAPYLAKLGAIVIRELQSSNSLIRSTAKRTTGVVNEYFKTLSTSKIKNYQNVSELKEAISVIQKFC